MREQLWCIACANDHHVQCLGNGCQCAHLVRVKVDEHGAEVRPDAPAPVTACQHGISTDGYCPWCSPHTPVTAEATEGTSPRKPFTMNVSREWIERMAKIEAECGDVSIGAGNWPVPSSPEAAPQEQERQWCYTCSARGVVVPMELQWCCKQCGTRVSASTGPSPERAR